LEFGEKVFYLLWILLNSSDAHGCWRNLLKEPEKGIWKQVVANFQNLKKHVRRPANENHKFHPVNLSYAVQNRREQSRILGPEQIHPFSNQPLRKNNPFQKPALKPYQPSSQALLFNRFTRLTKERKPDFIDNTAQAGKI
jgi:hypothetical protein